MSNKPMLSVERELLEVYTGRKEGDWVEAGHELRALLDKPETPMEIGGYAPSETSGAQMEMSDEWAQEVFSKRMLVKLEASAAKGRNGWQQCSQESLSRMLREHVDKGDPVDVANFCMFLDALGYGIAPAAQHQGEPVAYRWRVVGLREWTFSDCSVEFDARSNDDSFEAQALYAEQSAPVAVVMPERKTVPHIEAYNTNIDEVAEAEGWNEALDDVARLNGVKP